MTEHESESEAAICPTCGGEGVVCRGFNIDDPGRPEIVPCPYCNAVEEAFSDA